MCAISLSVHATFFPCYRQLGVATFRIAFVLLFPKADPEHSYVPPKFK